LVNQVLTDWFRQLPKVELHLHLEGAIPTDALWLLIQKYGGDPALLDEQALARRFVYRDFSHFIETWMWKNQYLRNYEDFSFIAEAVALDLASQNIRYAEAFFSPVDFSRHGLETQKLTEAIRMGLDQVDGIQINLVADLVRTTPIEIAWKTLFSLNELKELGVIGIGLGGPEAGYPPAPFTEIYKQARQMGFHTSAHAGESAGPDSIWGVIRGLEVERIGHGTRAYEDDALLEYLVEHQIPLEMCPISNLRTGVVRNIEIHPIRTYFLHGIPVTVNTDDPKMFGNSLAEEYQLLVERLGFNHEDIRDLIMNAVKHSWLADEQKRQLMVEFKQVPAWSQK
jgi:adenosine deaminase